jgi:hypothetical protein
MTFGSVSTGFPARGKSEEMVIVTAIDTASTLGDRYT